MTSVVYKLLYAPLRKSPNDIWSWPLNNVVVNIPFKASIFSIIGKKYNLSSFSDADREIPTLGSMDNAIVFGIIRLPSGY